MGDIGKPRREIVIPVPVPVDVPEPTTWSLAAGTVVPMPTLPVVPLTKRYELALFLILKSLA